MAIQSTPANRPAIAGAPLPAADPPSHISAAMVVGWQSLHHHASAGCEPPETGAERPPRAQVVAHTISVYHSVIDDVVAKVKSEFVQEGIDESVLEELRERWEQRLNESGAIGNQSTNGRDKEGAQGEAGPTTSAVVLEVEAAASRKRKLDDLTEDDDTGSLPEPEALTASAPPLPTYAPASIPQRDGPSESAPGEEGAPLESQAGVGEEDLGEEDEELGEDDDLEGLDMPTHVSEDEIANHILGQFDRVHRSKARWRMTLRDCILCLDDRDYLLHKVSGEFQF